MRIASMLLGKVSITGQYMGFLSSARICISKDE